MRASIIWFGIVLSLMLCVIAGCCGGLSDEKKKLGNVVGEKEAEKKKTLEAETLTLGGDTGEKVGNDAKKLAADMMADLPKDPKELQAKMKEIESKWRSKIEAIETRYKALSADEKKKADAILPGISEIDKKP